MRQYDPEVAPDPGEWLALDEGDRIHQAGAYHRDAGIDLPNTKVHAAIHTIVENQIAEGLDCTVRAMARLMKEGLSRHDALHAIGCVVTEHMHKALRAKDEGRAKSLLRERIEAEVDRLTARRWRRRYGS
ncbi:MAG: hypothetical protein AB1714_25840 [Acidobacteriota bacterium]